MTPLEQLLKRLPKKYHRYVYDFEREDGLIDNLKYMLYFNEKYIDEDLYGSCYPVKSITEAIKIIKNII